MASENYKAVVTKVVPKGKNGPYAVARSEIGTITFSLDRKVWQDEDCPDPGVHVMLGKVRRVSAGWRAMSARFVKPSDK